MTLRRFGTALVLALVSLAVAAATAGAATEKQRLPSLQFRGEATFPTGFQFAGTNVGGLSSITYDASRGVYYILSDDRSQLSPARFYTARIDLADGALNPGDVTFTGVTTLKQPDGSTFPIFSLDPEGMVLTERDGLVVTSEGDTGRLIPAFVRSFDVAGNSLRSFPVPTSFDPTTNGSSGIRGNYALEAAGVTPNGNFLYAAGNTIRISLVDLGRASDVDRFTSLAGQSFRPVEKTLLFDLDALGLTLDNVEGMTFGPTLPDGRRSLVLVSDNNFDPLAFTQFLVFAYSD